MSILTILSLVWLHFVADFVLQTDKMAINKSSSHMWLVTHVVTYTLPFLVFGWQFVLVNGVAHLLTDAVSSRLTSYYWKQTPPNRHMFFVVIGADQALHLTALFLSYYLLT